MSTEILINIGPRETRAALLENGVLQELFIERASRRGLVGNLYKRRVSRVLPGMQAAFVDVGLERTAFLHVDDIASPDRDRDAAEVAGASGDSVAAERAEPPDIRRLISPGDDILAQVVKDPIGGKGARLTTFVSLPSRFLVYMPRGRGIGVSARIEDEAERTRLRDALTAIVRDGHPGGYIVRTAAEGAPAEQLAADLAYLERLWTHVRQRSLNVGPGEIVHEDLALPLRVLRDDSLGVERILVDDAAECERMRRFASDFVPDAELRIELYAGARPIFDLHAVEEDINRALDRKVTLKSGGYLVIDQTESMTTIDVNTGGYVGYRNSRTRSSAPTSRPRSRSRGSCGCATSAASSSSTSST